MLEATQQPLGQTIHHIYRSPFFKKSRKKVWWAPAKDEVDGFVEELIRTVPEKGIAAAAEDLKGQAFELRLSLIELLASNDAFSLIQNLVQENMSYKEMKLELEGFHGADKRMAETYLESIKTYLKIVQGTAAQIGKQNIAQAMDEDDGSRGSAGYEEFRNTVLNISPHPWGQAFLAFLEASLTFEIGVIISELSLNREIRLPNKQKKAVSDLMFRSVEEMGANASFLGFWEPDEADEEQIVRNIKIRNASIASRKEEQNGYTLEELKKELGQDPPS